MNEFQHYVNQFADRYPRAYRRLMTVVLRTHTSLFDWMRANPAVGRELLAFWTSELEPPAADAPAAKGSGGLTNVRIDPGALQLARPTLQPGANIQDQLQRNARMGDPLDQLSDEELARELKRRHIGDEIFIYQPMPVSTTENRVDYEKWVTDHILTSDEWDVDGELMNAYRVYQYIKKYPRSAGRVAGVVADLVDAARQEG